MPRRKCGTRYGFLGTDGDIVAYTEDTESNVGLGQIDADEWGVRVIGSVL